MQHDSDGAEGGTRTRKPFRARDFKSLVYTIPPPRHRKRLLPLKRKKRKQANTVIEIDKTKK